MIIDGIFQIALILATLLSSLVAGFLFSFAIVIMPGISNLNDRDFIRAFQVMDRVIQNNQPIFILVWMGSIVAVAGSAVLGIWQLAGGERLLMISAAIAYIFGVQLPTIAVNVPLNNKLQTLDVDAMDETARKTARRDFETRWNRWNENRAAVAILASALFIILLFIL